METNFKRGDKVYFGRKQGEKTLGEVVKVNPKRVKIKQLETRGSIKDHPIGTVWNVDPKLTLADPATATPVAPPTGKRPDGAIIAEVKGIYGQLSPENLSCDGELPRSVVLMRARKLNKRLLECFAEIGREVSEEEAWGLPS